MATSNPVDTCSKTPTTVAKLQGRVSELADAMGLDSTCKQKAEISASQFVASVKIGSLLGGAKAQTSLDKASQSLEQEGCGTFLLKASEIVQAENNITCMIQRNETNSSVTVAANQVINLETLPLTETERQDKLDIMKIQTLAVTGLKEVPESVLRLFKYNLDAYDRSISLTNSQLIQKSTLNVKTLNKFTTTQVEEISRESRSITESIVENNIEQLAGTMALSPNAKDAISRSVEKNTLNSDDRIKTSLNNIKLDVSSSQGINLKTPAKITLVNSSIGQDTVIQLATKVVIDEAIQSAVRSTVELLDDEVIKREIKSDTGGFDDVIREQGESAEKKINAGGSLFPGDGDSSWWVYIVILIIAVLLIGGAYYYFTSGSRSVRFASNFVPGVNNFPRPPAPPLYAPR